MVNGNMKYEKGERADNSKYPTQQTSDKSRSKPNEKAIDRDTYLAQKREKELRASPEQLCAGCGHLLGGRHTYDACLFRSHPDFNHNPSVSFAHSETGKKWIAKGATGLPYPAKEGTNKPYNNNNNRGSQRNNRGNSSSFKQKGKLDNIVTEREDLYCSEARDSGKLPGLAIWNEIEIPLTLLIDTGALQGNCISRRLGDQLKAAGAHVEVVNKLVSSGLKSARQRAREVINFNLIINCCDKTNRKNSITIRATVLDIDYDVIIGLPTIRKHNIMEMCKEHFQSGDSEMLNATIEITNSNNEIRRLSNGVSMDNPLDYESDDDEIKYKDDPMTDYEINKNYVDDPVLMPAILGEDDDIEFREQLRADCAKRTKLFKQAVAEKPADVTPMEIIVEEQRWFTHANQQPPRPLSTIKQEEVRKQIEHMLKLQVIEPSRARAWSQVHLVPKPNNKWRFCIDFRALNKYTDARNWPIPNITHMIQRIGSKGAKYFGKIDLTSGYHQTPMGELSKEYTAFITHMGLYQWRRTPMGLKSAGSYFQQAMAHEVLHGLLYDICEVYLDDILIYAQTKNEFIINMNKIFDRLEERGITVNPEKCELGVRQIEFVGYVLSETGTKHSEDKILRFLELDKPQTVEKLRSFIGLANYFRNHIANHAIIMGPLTNMIPAGAKSGSQLKVIWTAEADKSYIDIKEAIQNCPELHFVVGHENIYLQTDASDYGVGAYLCQLRNGKEYPIAFFSRALTGSQRRWSTFEKESYAIYAALQKFDYLLRDVTFTLQTDHDNLTKMNTDSSPKVIRWKMAIQEYDCNIVHIRGADNTVADGMSRLCHNGAEDHSDDIDAIDLISRAELSKRLEALNILEENVEMLNAVHEPLEIEEKHRLIALVHNHVNGHHGVKRTLQRLKDLNLNWSL